MESLLSAFLAAALAEVGDKTQWLTLALTAHFRRPKIVMAALACAVVANAALAGLAGRAIMPLLNREAATLMLALALGSAAASMAMKVKPPPDVTRARAAFATSLILFLAAELGDKTQFLTFAIATRSGMPALAALGAALGVFTMAMAAMVGGRALVEAVPLKAARRTIAGLFALLAFVAAITALRLI